MNSELLDIVDENNNLTGEQKPRFLVHKTGLWHRVVHVYFFRKKNNELQFIVHLRSKEKDLHPNQWDTRFGGHIKAGQSIIDALKQEIFEETAVKLEPKMLLKGNIRKGDFFPNREFTNVFYYRYPGEIEDLHFDDGEVQTAKWMGEEYIKKSIQNNPEIWSAGLKGFNEISTILKDLIK